MTRAEFQGANDRFEVEQSLRASALDAKGTLVERRTAISILADFYEQHGQPSRAALWRELLKSRDDRPGERVTGLFGTRDRRHRVLEEVPDLQTRAMRAQAFDCRRSQMIWLLRKQGASVRKVAAAFGLSATRVEQIVALEDRRISMHARNEQLRPTLVATERLLAAGALPGDRPTRSGRQEPWCDLCDEPPEDWPAEHKRRVSLVEGKGQVSLVEGKGQVSLVEGKGQVSLVEGKGQVSLVEGKGQVFEPGREAGDGGRNEPGQ